jgi:hypothetical protein
VTEVLGVRLALQAVFDVKEHLTALASIAVAS